VVTWKGNIPVASVAVDPESRILQKEVRNDLYPDYLASEETASAIKKTIYGIIEAMNAHDVDGFRTLLASEQYLDKGVRSRMIQAVSNLQLTIEKPSDTEIFMTGKTAAEAVNRVTGSSYKQGRREVAFIKEDAVWKCSSLSIKLGK